MDLTKYITLEHGKIVIDTKTLVLPLLEDLKKQVEEGKIDPIKGTDLDKMAIELVIAQIEKQLE